MSNAIGEISPISAVLKTILLRLEPYLHQHFKAERFNIPTDETIEGKRINEVVLKNQIVFFDIGGKWKEVEEPLFDTKFLEDLCKELGNLRGERFNKENPSLATELPPPYARYRVQALEKEVLYQGGIEICIRIPNDERYPLESFALSEEVINAGFDYEKIKQLVREKKNILVSGGTGTGKTSFLNALLAEVDPSERILTIEDTKELFVENKNRAEILVSKQGRGFTYEQALNSAMRLRPDRIFLGEIDTKNTLTFLRLANTGHDGMVSTLHANTAYDSIQAILNNSAYNTNIAEKTILKFIKAGIHYILQLKTKREILENGEVIMRKELAEILDLSKIEIEEM